MSDQLEAVALLMDLSLPHGYRVRVVEGCLHLFDPQGVPLHGPSDSSLIEAHAWRHAWRHIEWEINKELLELHAGVNPVHRLRRLRQYMRMLDAVAQVPRGIEQKPVRRGVVAWATLAASAAAAAAVLSVTPVRTWWIPQSAPGSTTSTRPTTAIFGKHQAPALPTEPKISKNVRITPTAHRRPALEKYEVTFGKFVNRTTADTMMHFIRSKGYIVYVARIGEDFRVMTRPYRTHAQAERLANALHEIGLPAQLATTRQI
jgi:cell division septation protein DedD